MSVLPNTQAHYRLPSIHSLDLDLPVPNVAPAYASYYSPKPSSQPSGPSPSVVAVQPQPSQYSSAGSTGSTTTTHQLGLPHIMLQPIKYEQQQPSVQAPSLTHSGSSLKSPPRIPFISPISSPAYNHAAGGLSTLCAVATRRSSDPSQFGGAAAGAAAGAGAGQAPTTTTTPFNDNDTKTNFMINNSTHTPISMGSSTIHSEEEEQDTTYHEVGTKQEHDQEELKLSTANSPASGGAQQSSSGSSAAPFPTTTTTLEIANESSNPKVNKSLWKPRKKRQCPECHLFFSNLATHKSTHLKPTSRPHVCEYCNRGFARPNDLFRHVKRHWKETGSDKGQFKCPFKGEVQGGDHCCHSTGIFSRCDTFKNHLKAIHFQYPSGTKKDQRNKVAGTCRACQQHFHNVDEWMVSHVEKNACPYAGEFTKS
ncbi:transcriptional regulator Stp4p [[Candida] anglica]|uniref:Transcriptional regulator Stp4p n=1 Tax=[Candida] anglica TaxID=148631 RepID=A0ABP0EH72_9ASCO